MSRERGIARIRGQWRLYGLPRCYATDFLTGAHCKRLIWPWQAILGNGEEIQHAACRRREIATLDTAASRDEEAA